MIQRFIPLLFLAFLFSCGGKKNNTHYPNPQNVNLDGYWGNTPYIDELINRGQIQTRVLCTTVWKNLLFRVKGDTLVRVGMDHHPDTVIMSKNIDSLATLEGGGSYQLYYNSSKEMLQT